MTGRLRLGSKHRGEGIKPFTQLVSAYVVKGFVQDMFNQSSNYKKGNILGRDFDFKISEEKLDFLFYVARFGKILLEEYRKNESDEIPQVLFKFDASQELVVVDFEFDDENEVI